MTKVKPKCLQQLHLINGYILSDIMVDKTYFCKINNITIELGKTENEAEKEYKNLLIYLETL